MQIVIDKDKEINELKEMLNNLIDKEDIQSVYFAINLLEAIGTPLPKAHGRLIDVSEYFKKEFGDTMEFLDNATTIIEADTESEG